jgi:hypothetical protein
MLVSALSLVFLGPVGPPDPGTDVHECMHPDDPQVWSDVPDDPVSIAYDCTESKDTGYVQGDAFEITVVTVDGDPVEVETANAFIMLADAAAADGVTLKINSGFRTMQEQEYFYNCYINCSCNNCNVAAKPGFSNHQSGHAPRHQHLGQRRVRLAAGPRRRLRVDAHRPRARPGTGSGGGGGPPTSGPCGVVDYAAKFSAQSFPYASAPPIVLTVGDTLDAWIDLENVGENTWTGNTRLAPTPRDVASPLADPTWLSPTRITGPQSDTPSGGVGRFAFRFLATAPGDYYQTFGIVEEGVTWFSDKPLGGGPAPTTSSRSTSSSSTVRPPIPAPRPPTTRPAARASSATTATTAAPGIGEGGEAGDDTDAPTSRRICRPRASPQPLP